MSHSRDRAAPPPPVPPGKLSYADYLRVDELIALQHPKAEPAHHDEMQFIVVHQVFELWFRLLLHETDRVSAMLARGDDASLREAVHVLRRIARIASLLPGQIQVLESMKPVRFLGFRSVLEPASGFQSYQFRELEFAWGLKHESMMAHHASAPARQARLAVRFAAPSIADRFGAMLVARGHDWPAGAGGEAEARRIRTVKVVYEHPDAHGPLEELFECLLEVDAQLALWRKHHVSMVERQIGRKIGTGGSSGVGYLEQTFAFRFFPELWAVRTVLEIGPASAAPPA